MEENGLTSYSGVAAELGVSRVTISDLVITLGLEPKAMSNGKAKGLDRWDIKALRKALGKDRKPASATH